MNRPPPAEAPPPAPVRVPWLEIASLFLGSRLLILLVSWLSLKVVTPGKFFAPLACFRDAFMIWDANWYAGIAGSGYNYSPEHQSSVAFFPLYPMLMRYLGPLFGSISTAGFVISNAALFGAVVLLWKMAEELAASPGNGLQPGDGSRAVRLLLLGPVSFFHSIVYSEALFLFLIVASVYAARRRAWWLAGLAGYAAALTRNAGVLLAIPLFLEYFDVRFRPFSFRRDAPWLRATVCVLPVLGFLTWALYLAARFGDPFVVLKVQAAWARSLTWPWVSLIDQGTDFYHYWFKGHAIVALLLVAVCAWGRLRPSILLFGAALMLLNVSARHLEAIPRLTSVIFPLYFGWAILVRRWPALETPLVGFSSGLLVFSTLLFVNGYWFT